MKQNKKNHETLFFEVIGLQYVYELVAHSLSPANLERARAPVCVGWLLAKDLFCTQPCGTMFRWYDDTNDNNNKNTNSHRQKTYIAKQKWREKKKKKKS